MTAHYESETALRSEEAEELRQRVDPHGQITTPADVEATIKWREKVNKEGKDEN